MSRGRAVRAGVVLLVGMTAGGVLLAQAPGGQGGGGAPLANLNFGGGGSTRDRQPVQRVLQGVVRTKDGGPVKDAIVYLKDGKTSTVKSMHVDDTGAFKFVQLSKNVDYELWAKAAEKKTPSRTVSSMDPKNDITLNLKME